LSKFDFCCGSRSRIYAGWASNYRSSPGERASSEPIWLGTVGRSNLHCWTTEQGSVLAGWLYEIGMIAVSVCLLKRAAGSTAATYGIPNPTRVQSACKLWISDISVAAATTASTKRQHSLCRAKPELGYVTSLPHFPRVPSLEVFGRRPGAGPTVENGPSSAKSSIIPIGI
jgi:hypothetical protein